MEASKFSAILPGGSFSVFRSFFVTASRISARFKNKYRQHPSLCRSRSIFQQSACPAQQCPWRRVRRSAPHCAPTARAGRIDTIKCHFIFQALHGLSAGRAIRRRFIFFLFACPRINHRTDDIGDHLPCPFDQHPVTDADIFLRNVVEVMQRGTFDNHTANLNRFQHCVGDQHTSAPDIDLYILEVGRYFAGREFECDGAARVLADKAQIFARFKSSILMTMPSAS